MIEIIVVFLCWTLMLYLIHRLVHIPYLYGLHKHHHEFISKNGTSWQWSNLFLFTDDMKSTLDMWVMEIIPTILFCIVFGNWWLLGFYYVWAAFLQDTIEHSNLNWYPLTSGAWHLKHHENPKMNFGMFHPLWDKVFKTELR